MILIEQTVLTEIINILACMLLIILLEYTYHKINDYFIRVNNLFFDTNLTDENSQPFYYSLPIMLVLCIMLSGSYLLC